MALRTFSTVNNTLDPAAALQQAILMVLVDYYQPTMLANYLSQHGQWAIHSINDWEGSALPAWAILTNEGNTFVTISGTANRVHLMQDLYATCPRQWHDERATIHPGFAQIADTLVERLRNPLVLHLVGKLCICGFSMGGAVAQALALALPAIPDQDATYPRVLRGDVQNLTFASPRVFTDVLQNLPAGAWPASVQRIAIDGDPVVRVPPQNTQLLLRAVPLVFPTLPGVGLLHSNRMPPYQHYHRCFYFNTAGQLLRFADTDTDPAFNPAGDFAVHSSGSYFRVMRRWAQELEAISAADEYGCQLCEVVLGDRAANPPPTPPNPAVLPSPNNPVFVPEPPGANIHALLQAAPSLEEINQLFYDGAAQLAADALDFLDEVIIEFQDVQGDSSNQPTPFNLGTTMAGPAYSGTYRQEIIINDGVNSLREQMFFLGNWNTGDHDDRARERVEQYLSKRKELLGGADEASNEVHAGRPGIVHAGYADAKQTRRGNSWDVTGNKGLVTPYAALSDGDTLWKRLVAEFTASTGGVNPIVTKRLLLLGGLPDDLILKGLANVPNIPTWKTRWENFVKYLCGDDGAQGAIGAANSGFGMMVHDRRDGTGNKPLVVIGSDVIAGAPTLFLATSATADGGNVQDGDTFQVQRANVPGWNGKYKVRITNSGKTITLLEPPQGSSRYIFDIIRASAASLPKATYAQLMRVRRKDGVSTKVLARFTAATLLQIVRKRPSPAWSPYQKKRTVKA